MNKNRWFEKDNSLMFQLKFVWFFTFSLVSFIGFSQTNNDRWEDHFSYNNIRHIWEINGFIFCSAENGLFNYDPNSGELEKISKVTELNDVGISAFSYSPELDFLLVGYERGEMDMLGPDENHNLLEIPLHQSYTGSKIVNHIFPYQNTAIISGEFGLASFSLDEFEFMETCYFTQNSVYFGVKESVVLNDVIYAASDRGIFSHALDEFIANFTSWTQPAGLPTSAFQQIVVFQGNLVAATGNTVYRFDGNNWTNFGTFQGLRDLSVNGNVLSITQTNSVTNYNETFGVLETVSFTQTLNTGLKIGNTTYGGSQLFGLINNLEEIKPDGPYNNKSYSITALGNQIWIAPGGMNNYNSPQQNADGFFHFNGTEWIHNTSEEMLNAKDIVDIEVNPMDSTEIYVSSWFEHPSWNESNISIGMFKFKSGQMVEHYNHENSSLMFRERIGGSTLDEDGNLWIGQSYVGTSGDTYMVRKTASGNWESIDLNAAYGTAGSRKPVVYQGYGFLPLPRSQSGLKVTNMQEVYTINGQTNSGNLPANEVLGVAIDQDGILWIGTTLGLRVLYNPIEAVQSGSFQAEPVIIEQDGIPEAVLTDVAVTDIQIDGANQKWVATDTGGVYCFSEDGTETVYHFTAENSPLPSNRINKIKIEMTTGVVYFATDKGVMSFRSDAVTVGDAFGDVYSYPNPVRPGFNGDVTIKGLPNEADVRIVDVVGNLVFKTKASGGVAKWDTRNMNGKLVASGIYLVLMSNQDATETKQTKIAIVR